jgi:hypothetical protein
MSTFLRRIRGILGMGLTWAVLWAAFGALLGLAVGAVDPASIDPGESPLLAGAILGLVGFISGAGCGILIAFGERGKPLVQLSLARAALWGTLAAAAWPLLTGVDDRMVYILCPLGAVLSVASVALARRAALPEGERPRLQS